MKLLLRDSFTATLKTFRHMVRNGVVCGFTTAGNSESEKNRQGLATHNKLIEEHCLMQRVEEGVGILRGMAEKGLSPDALSYGYVISGFCNNRCPGKAYEFKLEMDEKGILPDAVTYSSLIQALCPKRRLSEAFHLFQEMLRGGVCVSPPDYITFTTLMHASCLEGEFSKAFHMHHHMIHKGFLPDFVTGFSPSLVTYNAIIHGLCFLGRVEEALGILRGMPEMGLSPDAVSYRIVISGFCQNREMRKAYELKVEMDRKDVWGLDEVTYAYLMQGLSDEDTYASLINAYCAQGELFKVLTLDDEMSHKGSLPDSVSYSLLINGLDKKARTKDTKEHLLLIIANHMHTCMPNYIIHDTLIENCSNNEFKSMVGLVKSFSMRGLVNEAARAHDTMLQGNYKPDGAVYNLLIFDHCRRLNVHKAYNMYMEMVRYGFVSHMFSVLALLNALRDHGMYNEMSWVIQNTLRSCNLNDSELHKVLDEIDPRKYPIDLALLDVLAEIAMDGLLLDGRKCSYASAST